MKKLVVIFILWFIVINVFAILSLNRFNLNEDTSFSWIAQNNFSSAQTWDVVSIHEKWDSYWYIDIAQKGYLLSPRGIEQLPNVAFFPLYPYLIKETSFLTGGNLVLTGWILSTIFLFLACLYLFKLVKEFHPEIDPHLPVILLLIFPTSFFLNAVYAESLFLFLSLAVFYYGLRGNFFLAGVLGFLASLTRITGMLLFIPLVWEYFKNYDFKFSRALNLKILSIFLVPAGTLSFFLYDYFKFGNFFLYFTTESQWNRPFFKLSSDFFSLATNAAIVNFCLDFFFLIFVLIVTFFVFKKLRISYGLYMLATLATVLSSGTTMAIGRFILVLFPIYILGASIKNKNLQLLWIFSSILLLAIYTLSFVSTYWAG